MLKDIVLSLRPKTFTASLAPIMAGSALAFSQNKFSINLVPWILLCVILLQAGTNLFNDVLDFQKGADRKGRLGPQRVTQKEIFTEKQVFFMASLCFFMSFLFSIPLIVKGGLIVFILALACLSLGYLYTGTRFSLAYNGLAEPFVVFFFGVVAVSGTFYLHTGQWERAAFLLGLQIGFFCTTLLVINNLRDSEEDKKAKKNTLVVRLGLEGGRWELVFLYFLAFLLHFLWASKTWTFFLPLVTIPFVVRLLKQVFKTPPSKKYNQFLAQASFLHLSFSFLVSLGLVGDVL